MSGTTAEPASDGKGGLLSPVNSVMGAIFDSVVDPPAEPPAETGAPAAPETGAEPPATGAPPAAPAVPAAPAPAGDAPPAAEQPPAPVQSAPPVVTVDDKVVVEQFGKIGEALEARFTTSFEQQAVAEAEDTYPEYINALKMHPLELVGKELPPIDGSGNNVVLRTAQDVEQWQGAVRTILKRELDAAVQQRRQDSNEVLDVVHGSIQMFQANPDLVPGAKSYNKALAVEFLRIAEPYALRMNGKLTGYSIPVQGLVDRVRAQVTAAAAAAPGSPAAPPKAPAPKPQAGIPSTAGASGNNAEDYSPMWAALGIKNMPI